MQIEMSFKQLITKSVKQTWYLYVAPTVAPFTYNKLADQEVEIYIKKSVTFDDYNRNMDPKMLAAYTKFGKSTTMTYGATLKDGSPLPNFITFQEKTRTFEL